MGTDLGDLIEPEQISFDHLVNKEIAIDAMNTMYQFLSIIRQRDGTPLKDADGNVTSHLSGLFYRNVKLVEKGVKPVYVLDGSPPDLKAKEAKERRKKREKAEEEWKKLKEEGKMKKAFQKATQSSKLTGEMVEEATQLLDALGIPHVQAPSEGEAQAAWMNAEGQAWAVGGQDWDALLFGADRLVRNLTVTGRRKKQGGGTKHVSPEKIEARAVFDDLGLSREKLTWLAILIGTDFDPGGVHGIGPKRGMDLVQQYDSFDELLEDDKVEWEHDNDPHRILDFFQDPPVDEDVSYSHGSVDRGEVRHILVEKHGFSGDRVASTLDRLEEAQQESQQDLGSFV
ncbi:MAG: flap endonuclease-1 [Candidatus Nanohaloarchaea archaeon]|nr:flap endonuclease-1 [Candidatus Nanohaloarchaea archaeon]